MDGYDLTSEKHCKALSGSCANGELIEQSLRRQENHCGRCDSGYELIDDTCKEAAPTSAPPAGTPAPPPPPAGTPAPTPSPTAVPTPPPASCSNGVPEGNTDVCKSCFTGYYLTDDKTCEAWGGSCENGELIEQDKRYKENHCGSCDDGFDLIETECKAPTTTKEVTMAPTPAPPAEGCMTGVKVRIQGHQEKRLSGYQGHHRLQMTWNLGDWEEWTLEYAGEGDGKYFIVNPDGQALTDDKHANPRIAHHKGEWETWDIIQAGQGKVFLRSWRGLFLQDNRDRPWMIHNADAWEKWEIYTVDGGRQDPACYFPDVTFFCFVVMHSEGNELALMKHHFAKEAGIFGCNTQMVFSDASVDISDGQGLFFSHSMNHEHLNGAHDLFENHHLFVDVWEEIRQDGRYHSAHWVVKSDPETVFMPDRLRARLGGQDHAERHPTFYANCRRGGKNTMYGPLEVFSAKAIDIYFEGAQDKCEKHTNFEEKVWEEEYMTECLQKLGVPMNQFRQLKLLSDPHCDPNPRVPDCESEAVAFHPLHTTDKWEACYKAAHHGEFSDGGDTSFHDR